MSAPADEPRRDSLWWLAASPAIWVGHFLACYITAAVFCAKAGRDAALTEVRWVVLGATVAALGGIAAVGWRGWGRRRFGVGPRTHEHDTPEDRHRFLGLATILLSGLAAVAAVFVALPAVFLETCR